MHDVVEDTVVTVGEIELEFGADVAQLVDGVTKISSIQMLNKEERQAETFRKILLSMAKDIRVILIKFADRLHNLRTLEYLSPDKVKNISQETLDVYAPLAHRLGMAKIRCELEDLAFKHLYPKEYQDLIGRIRESLAEREKYIESLALPLREELQKEEILAEVSGRPKHYYSIYRKMKQRNMHFDEIYDRFALRIITKSIKDCYVTLGIVHSLWNPLTLKFKDYIASPKSNMYQSIHTTVVGPDGRMFELQIRTEAMHQTAEAGIAAHWYYKEGGRFSPSEEHMAWLDQMAEWQKDISDSNEFLEFFKIDLFPAEIFIFTPRGDVIQLQKGATVLDFAFSIHTNLGIHCIGCKINDKVMPIDTPLKSGSTVEILRSENQRPTVEWLRYVRTGKAKSALRRWLNQEGKVQSQELGNELLLNEYNKLNSGIPYKQWLLAAAAGQELEDTEMLLEAVGQGNLSTLQVLHAMPDEQTRTNRLPMMKRLMHKVVGGPASSAILIDGEQNVMIRFARCCMPIPGEKIVGFITKGRGVAVHRMDCPNAIAIAGHTERHVSIDWNPGTKNYFKVRIEVIAKNRINLLSELTHAIAKNNANIVHANIVTRENVVHDIFIVDVVHARQLKRILASLKKVKGVQNVTRGRQEEEPQRQGA
jgi:GTP pyrophosphokinase